MAKIFDANGGLHDVPVSVTMYRQAAEAGQNLQSFLAANYATDIAKYGSPFEQLCESEGIYLRDVPKLGIRKTTMHALLDGVRHEANIATKDQVPTSRIFAPAVLMQAIEDKLQVNLTETADAFDSMVAIDDSIDGDRYDQPRINFSKAEQARSQGISQLALPPSMMFITVADRPQKIPNYALGLEVSDQALKATTIDFVALSLARQAAVEKNDRAQQHVLQMLNGDIDTGESSLATLGQVVTSNSLDASATGGVMTQDAWVKFLVRGSTKRKTTHIVTDLTTALKLERRTGRPTVQTDDAKSTRIDTAFQIMNPQWPVSVKIFLSMDPAWPAATVMGLDSRFAIRRVRNLSAEYNAIESYVLKRSQALRFDFGEHVTRLFDESFDVLTVS